MEAILPLPLLFHWIDSVRKNMALKVVNMKRIWLGVNYTNFHDSFIAWHTDSVHELCLKEDDSESGGGMQRFNELHTEH